MSPLLPLLGLVAVLASAGSPPGKPSARSKDPTKVVDGGALDVSQATVDNTVNHETGGYAYFQKFYQRPSDPGYSSGVTVGFGYDLKFHTRSQIRKDWAGIATPAEIEAMCSVAGLDGAVYRRIRNKVRINWDEGMIVFKKVTLPRWTAKTAKAYKIAAPDDLHPHLNGALLGNTFNRGPSMSGSRAHEKRQIRDAIAQKRWDDIPGYFEAQQRWWPGHAGLTRRRREEGGFARKANGFEWWKD